MWAKGGDGGGGMKGKGYANGAMDAGWGCKGKAGCWGGGSMDDMYGNGGFGGEIEIYGKGGFGGKDGKAGKDGKSKGKGAQKIASGEQVYTGRVKTFDVEKKRGYIVSEEVFNQSGQDVYVFEKVLSQSGGGPGDLVAFFLHWSASGQPQASAPILRISGESEYALKGSFKPGTDEKGHGFLTCDATKDFFGRDVYVNKDLAAQLHPGQAVAFNAYLNRDRMPNVDTLEPCDASWEPNPGDLTVTRTAESVASKGACPKGKGAKGTGKDDWGKGTGKDDWGKGDSWGKGAPGPDSWDSWGCGGGWGGGWDDGWGMKGGKMGMKGGWDAWGCGKGGKDGGYGKDGGFCKGKGKKSGGGVLPTTPSGETFVGIIKSFNEKTGYGFISCEEVTAKYGGDCFCAKKFLGDHQVGDMVEFDVGLTPEKKPQAIAIRATGGGSVRGNGGWDPPESGEYYDFNTMSRGNQEQEDALAALQADLANLGDLAMEPMLKKPRTL